MQAYLCSDRFEPGLYPMTFKAEGAGSTYAYLCERSRLPCSIPVPVILWNHRWGMYWRKKLDYRGDEIMFVFYPRLPQMVINYRSTGMVPIKSFTRPTNPSISICLMPQTFCLKMTILICWCHVMMCLIPPQHHLVLHLKTHIPFQIFQLMQGSLLSIWSFPLHQILYIVPYFSCLQNCLSVIHLQPKTQLNHYFLSHKQQQKHLYHHPTLTQLQTDIITNVWYVPFLPLL